MPVSSADYKIEAEVSTSNAVTNLRAMRSAANDLTGTLKQLNTVTAAGEKDLNTYAQSISKIIAAQNQAAKATTALAQARLKEAQAAGQEQVNTDRAAESQARQALTAQRTATTQAQGHLANTRAANEYLRTESALTSQQQQRQIAQERLTMAQDRQAASSQRAARSNLELNDNLSNTRYLLYDVGATYRTMSLGLEALPVATAAVAASYQKDFAQVIRVTGQTTEQAASLRAGLVNLTTELPVSFKEIDQIAQLGAHLQLGNEGLVQFTETVAKFAAATGAGVQETAQGFSRMQTMMQDAGDSGSAYFNKLGSSIAEVGTVSKVSDAAVMNMVTGISSATATARMSTETTVGLASALASLAVQPEMARGALTRLFSAFNRDSANSADKMAEFGKVMKMTGEQATQLWKTDPNQFFMDLLKGLHDAYAGGQNLTVLFDQMGVKNVRDIQTLTRLAVGYDQLTTSMDAAKKGFEGGTALDELSKPVFETLAAKIQELGNAFKALGDSLGSGSIAPLTGLVNMLVGAVKWIAEMANQAPAVKVLINVLLGLSAVTGVFLGLKAAQAYVLAGMISMRSAMNSSAAGVLNTSGLMKQLAVNMLMSKGASDAMATSMVRNATALGAMRTALTSTSGRLQSMGTVSSEMGNAMTTATSGASRLGTGMKTAFSSALSLVGGPAGLVTMIGVGLVTSLMASAQAAEESGKRIAEAFKQGQSAGQSAVASEMNNTKFDFNNSGNIGDWGKSITQVASQFGLSMDQIIAAVGKGKNGLADLQTMFDGVAQSKGFKDLTDMANSPRLGPGDADSLTALKSALDKMASGTAQSTDDIKKTDDALKKLGGDSTDTADGIDSTTTAADKLDKKLKELNDTIFGAVDAEAAMGDSLNKLGGDLQKSGSFGNNADGRNNTKNFEKALQDAQKYYAALQEAGKATSAQAAQGYADFVDGLIKKTQAMGGQLGPIEGLARQTVDGFRSAMGADTAANPPTVQVAAKVNPAQAQQAALTAGQTISAVLEGQTPTVRLFADSGPATAKVDALAHDLSTITGMPYQAVLDALTDPANKNAKAMQDYITQIVNGTYKAAVNADTSAAVSNVKSFYNYAVTELSKLQSAINSIAASGAPGLAKYIGQSKGVVPGQGIPYKSGGYNFGSAGDGPAQVSAAPVVAAANSSAASALPALANMNQGYDDAAAKAEKAADKAEKAGQKGKKAGKDTAEGWKDAGNAIDQATAAADDYASRLKQGLDRAFERQYGLQQATDDYHKQLNAIAKTREDDLKKVDDLISKTRQLNDEKNKDLIDAGKAKIEQGISLKYGETARAADYGQQAQTALDNAASKQKEIDANNKEAATVKAGIGLLTGYSDAAIANREALRSLEQKQNDMIVAYAKTGATIDQVRAYAANLTGQFQIDVGQIGFNRGAVQGLTGDLGRYIDVINRVPYVKPTTVTADVGTSPGADGSGGSGALGDLGTFQSALDQATQDKTVNVKVNWTMSDAQLKALEYRAQQSTTSGPDASGNGRMGTYYTGGQVLGFASGGMVPGTPPSDPHRDNMLAQVDGKGLVQVRSREFIEPEAAVDYYGLDFMEAIRTMQLPKFNFGGSVGGSRAGSGSSGPVLVELTAAQLTELAAAVGADVKVMVDSREIARASNKGNRELQKEGAR